MAIVDSDSTARARLAAALRSKGAEVVEWDRGRSALEALLPRAPDALVIAAQLADSNGLDLVARLRARHTRMFPIVVLSSDPADAERALLVGATETALTPVDVERLVSALDRLRHEEPLGPDLPRDHLGLVFGRYRLLSSLGRGSFGEVFEAWDEHRGAAVALKVLSPAVEDPDDLARFVREAQVLANVNDPHVVRMLGAGLFEGRAFCAMGLVDGPTLEARVRIGGRLSEAQSLEVMRGLLRALDALAQRNLVHRDVTPRNVILEAGQVARPKLIDFGLAKPACDHTLTAPDVILGTPGYIAPEVVFGAEADSRSDLFAVGVIGVFALFGRHPCDGRLGMALLHHMAEHPVELPTGVSPSTHSLLASLTALDPDRRPASPRHALVMLAQAVAQLEVTPRRGARATVEPWLAAAGSSAETCADSEPTACFQPVG